ncbi:MAG TPA: hypothetical protein VJI32_05515 [Candidatus Nanoarchaeia archaeon]|nr:hypothetical protein [Candidatus Nanoarchaeia archaeon]
MLKEKIRHIYEQKYKTLLIIPLLLLLLSLAQIGYQYGTTGDFVHKGIALKGGSTFTINYQAAVSPALLEEELQQQFPDADVSIRTITSTSDIVGYTIETNLQEKEDIESFLAFLGSKVELVEGEYSTEVIDSSLGQSFFLQTAWALLIAFILMAIVVFVYFRMLVPSLSVILVAFSDIVTTLAIFNLTGSKLTTGGVAAFLMLVGYSVDTEMLLNSKALKQPGSVFLQQIYSAISTGMTMTLTVLAAVFVALIFVNNDVVKQIMLVLFIGLLVDMVNSWILNVGLLRWHMEKRGRHHG